MANEAQQQLLNKNIVFEFIHDLNSELGMMQI